MFYFNIYQQSVFFSMFFILVMWPFNMFSASCYTSSTPFASVVPRGALSLGEGGGLRSEGHGPPLGGAKFFEMSFPNI